MTAHAWSDIQKALKTRYSGKFTLLESINKLFNLIKYLKKHSDIKKVLSEHFGALKLKFGPEY